MIQAAVRAQLFARLALDQVDKPALWGAKGGDAFDCSGLVTWCLCQLGGPDYRHTHGARHLHEISTPVDAHELGAIALYGEALASADHVVICLAGGHVVGASGAKSSLTDLAAAIAAGARVRVRQTHLYSKDRNFLGFRRLNWLHEVTACNPS